MSIDDFGTGYSSFGHLHRLPIDEVKIDRSFVSALGEDEGARTLVRSIVGLVNDLGLEAVAEGIEHEEEAAILAELGCTYAQGYLFAKPLPVPAFERFVQDQRVGTAGATGMIVPAFMTP
jgi:diguanylate cyclase